jgi:Lon protease-like protein
MLPATIPLFPLPNVVLFPNVFLPLHIFEPRYRAMVADALDGDRLIGMVLLRPGWEGDYEGRPPVFPIGCAGLISQREDDSRLYRLGEVSTLHEPLPETDREEVRSARRRLETLLVPQPEGRAQDPKVPPAMSDEDLINALAQYMELEPLEKQALLERHGLLERCRSLIELLEMKLIVARHDWTKATN